MKLGPVIRALTLMILFSLLGCAGGEKKSWSENMRGMAQAFSDLVPYIYNHERFSDPQNKPMIKTKIDQLNFHADSLDKHVARGLSGDDPLFQVGLKGLKRNLRRSAEAYFVESYEYSQQLLKNSVNYCSKCHMRTNMGRKFLVYDQFDAQAVSQVEPVELAKAKVALRQFDAAVQILQDSIDNKKNRVEDKVRGAQLLLSITLKNLSSTEKALATTKRLQKTRSLKKYNKAFRQWESYIKTWKSKEQKLTLAKTTNTHKAKRFSHFMETLHHSLYLHQQLSLQNNKKKRAEVLYALGKIYQAQPALGFWELPDQYFEACIYQYPHSALSKRCYFQLERRVRKGFNLGMEAVLPKMEKTHLKKLEVMTTKIDYNPSGRGGYDDL